MKAKVLIIEDNMQNRYLFSLLLKNEGWRVVEAGDGRTGIEMALETRPNLILLDIQLPDMDGYEVVKRLRKKEDLVSTPIVAVTSFAMVGDREKALKAGCNGYIEKPINPKTFINEVAQFLLPPKEKE